MRDGEARLAARDARQQRAPLHCCAVAPDHLAGEHGLGHRGGHQRTAEFLEHEHEIDERQAGALVLGVDQQRLQAQAAQALPQLGVEAARGGARLARPPAVAQEAAHAVAQLVLLGVEVEVHGGAGYFGRPSTCSAMMLRWISEVPE